MNTISEINFKKICRISPSQFNSMKNCAYKSILAEAFEKKPLLPISPNAYLGTVLHKMLELISKGEIRNEVDFDKNFDLQIKIVEELLQKEGFGFFVPLQKNVKNFGIKKILLKRHLKVLPKQGPKRNIATSYSEMWYESKDKMIGGKIDLVIEFGEEIEIIDFKTGAITHDVLDDAGETFSEIKEEYKDQLRLYGYLYFETTNRFPTSLSLVDLAKKKFKISFSRLECNAIFEQAKIVLQSANESVESRVFDANPTQENCKCCLYRPACSFFKKQLEGDTSFNDIFGVLKNVVRYLNGNLSIFLQNGEKHLTVTSFLSDKYDEFNALRNKTIYIYNLRKGVTGFVYSATRTTKIYG